MQWLTPKEACEYSKLSRSYLYQLMSERTLPHHKVGRKTLIKIDDLNRLLGKTRVEAIGGSR